MQYQHADPNPLPHNEVSGKTITEDPWGEYMKRFAKHLKSEVAKKKTQEGYFAARIARSLPKSHPYRKLHDNLPQVTLGKNIKPLSKAKKLKMVKSESTEEAAMGRGSGLGKSVGRIPRT